MQHGADTFSVMEGRSEGYPVVAMIRSQLQEYKAKVSTPWFFGFSTPLSRATPEGLPTAEEADDLNRWVGGCYRSTDARAMRMRLRGSRDLEGS
jgi:hypothetical protein